jgi:hypothetical protein
MPCKYYIVTKRRYCRNQAQEDGYCSCHRILIPKIQRPNEPAQKSVNKLWQRSAKTLSQRGGGDGSGPNSKPDAQYISPYAMIASKLPPNPQQQSWYHYQAPVYQSFGDYVCIKKSFIMNAKNLVNEIFTEQLPAKN